MTIIYVSLLGLIVRLPAWYKSRIWFNISSARCADLGEGKEATRSMSALKSDIGSILAPFSWCCWLVYNCNWATGMLLCEGWVNAADNRCKFPKKGTKIKTLIIAPRFLWNVCRRTHLSTMISLRKTAKRIVHPCLVAWLVCTGLGSLQQRDAGARRGQRVPKSKVTHGESDVGPAVTLKGLSCSDQKTPKTTPGSTPSERRQHLSTSTSGLGAYVNRRE